MKQARMLVMVPWSLKKKLDALRTQGTSTSGFIRWLVEQHFAQASKKGR